MRMHLFLQRQTESHTIRSHRSHVNRRYFELDLTLRNNITTEEHPLGVYHPHAQYHHIKKENIGLIEVMGLAVLPARLKEELELLEEYILEGKDIASNEKIEKHAAWVAEFLPKYEKLDKRQYSGCSSERSWQCICSCTGRCRCL